MPRLTFADYRGPVEGPVDLWDEYRSHRAFWAAVLQFALADNGDAVHYQLDDGEDCLKIEICGTAYVLVPPPQVLRKALLAASKRLAPWGKVRQETSAGDITWRVTFERSGVHFSREDQSTVPNASRYLGDWWRAIFRTRS